MALNSDISVQASAASTHGPLGSSAALNELDVPYDLAPETARAFREDGFVHLRRVVGADVLAFYRSAIAAKVAELSSETLPLEQRTTYGKAFLQVMNLWRSSEAVRQLVFSRRLAEIAARLLGCSGVRLYHDQALFKEPGGGITPWHADQYYWPLGSDRTVTAWIPLTAVSLDMGPLAFAPGSQRLQDGRDVAIGEESEERLAEKVHPYGMVERPFDVGDISFHLGWTFHRADPNSSARMREAFTIIYLDREMRLAPPHNSNQQTDWERWCPGVEIGSLIDSELNPVLWPGVGGKTA
jgi:ectoine hydroxylase-related dioxygenase (phytanoyl-CoA dioxygenase family)